MTASSSSSSLYAQQDHYAVLSLPTNATVADITKRYRQLSLVHHPDRKQHHTPQQRAEEEEGAVFASIVAAYDVLKDEAKRAEYDARRGLNFGHRLAALQKAMMMNNNHGDDDISHADSTPIMTTREKRPRPMEQDEEEDEAEYVPGGAQEINGDRREEEEDDDDDYCPAAIPPSPLVVGSIPQRASFDDAASTSVQSDSGVGAQDTHRTQDSTHRLGSGSSTQWEDRLLDIVSTATPRPFVSSAAGLQAGSEGETQQQQEGSDYLSRSRVCVRFHSAPETSDAPRSLSFVLARPSLAHSWGFVIRKMDVAVDPEREEERVVVVTPDRFELRSYNKEGALQSLVKAVQAQGESVEVVAINGQSLQSLQHCVALLSAECRCGVTVRVASGRSLRRFHVTYSWEDEDTSLQQRGAQRLEGSRPDLLRALLKATSSLDADGCCVRLLSAGVACDHDGSRGQRESGTGIGTVSLESASYPLPGLWRSVAGRLEKCHLYRLFVEIEEGEGELLQRQALDGTTPLFRIIAFSKGSSVAWRTDFESWWRPTPARHETDKGTATPADVCGVIFVACIISYVSSAKAV